MTHTADLNRVAIAILELELMGFTFSLDGEKIKYSHNGAKPDPAQVYPKLGYIEANKTLALEYLRTRTEPVDITHRLFEAAGKSAQLARSAESIGELERARAEWKRFARLYAAFAEQAEIEPSGIGWDEWATSFEAP